MRFAWVLLLAVLSASSLRAQTAGDVALEWFTLGDDLRLVPAPGQGPPKARPAGVSPPESKQPSSTGTRVVARVNGEPILEEDVRAVACGMPAGADEAEKAKILDAKLEEVIDREVFLQFACCRARKNGAPHLIDKLQQLASSRFEKLWLQPMLRANGLTEQAALERSMIASRCRLEAVRRAWERQFIAREIMNSLVGPMGDNVDLVQVLDYYHQYRDEFRVEDGVTWQDLFVAAGRHPSREVARRSAEALLARVRMGEDFVRLSREHDNGDSSLRANSAGIGHKRGEIRPVEAEAVLFGLEDGEAALVEMELGFHVVRLVKRQHAGRRPFEVGVQKEIYEKLRSEVVAQAVKRTLVGLRAGAVIESVAEPEGRPAQ